MKKIMVKQQGFTLIELITVIIILGILAVGMSQFLGFGSRIFSETSARDELISSARFSIERLNRELRHALPNSLVINDDGNCLSFTPIKVSTVYTDIPVSPEAKSKIVQVIPFAHNDGRFSADLKMIVYPLKASDLNVNSGKIYEIDTLTPNSDIPATPWQITIASPVDVHFSADSPTQRIYFIDSDTQFCIEGSSKPYQLYRYQNNTDRSLMADNIAAYNLSVNEASQTRNATAQVQLTFELNLESVTFNNEVQIQNVP
ncbi:type II secretion system protein J [Colwelliaceae bacterium 6441]